MAEGVRCVNGAEAVGLAPLFQGCGNTMLLSALEGEMGRVWLPPGSGAPQAALVECADFLMLAGEPALARDLLTAWKAASGGRYAVLTVRGAALLGLPEQVFGADAKPITRYAFAHDASGFDLSALRRMADQPPSGIALRPFDKALYHMAMQAEWSRDFCSQFRNVDDYLARGLGVAALWGGELVGGASSYTRYSAGVEVQVETRADMRRRGIAQACCAAMLLLCMERGLYPGWDAANEASARLALRLGYRMQGPYRAWDLYQPKEC